MNSIDRMKELIEILQKAAKAYYADINNYLDLVLKQNHYLVDSLIPEVVSIGEIRYILAQLISDRISIRDIVFIFEKIGDFAGDDEETDLVEEIRMSLSRQISESVADEDGHIAAYILGDDAIDIFCNLIENEEEGSPVDIKEVNKIIDKVDELIFDGVNNPEKTPLIVPVEVRAVVNGVLKGFLPNIKVIAKEELSKDYRLEVLGEI